MSWNPDNPFPTSAALGETDSGARNLPPFLCSLLEPGPVLVVGASDVVLAAAARHPVTVVDWSRRRLARLDEAARDRGLEVRLICKDPEREEIGVASRSVRNVICLDVLERFREDVRVLEKLHRVLEAGGRLVVRVPSCRWIREEAGSDPRPARRYGPEDLRGSLEEAGFRTLRVRHWNFLGVPVALVWDRVLKRPHRDDGGLPASERSRHWWDGALDAWFGTVENRMGLPFGVSLVAVATPFLDKAHVPQSEPARGFPRRAAREAYEPMGVSR